MATACSSSAASGKKRKRVVLTNEDKLKICDLVKNGGSLTSVAAEFNLIGTFHLSEPLRSQRVRINDSLLYKIVTRLYQMVVTTLSPGCDNLGDNLVPSW